MAVRIAESPWTSRPPRGVAINWGDPLSQGLVAFIDSDGDRVSGLPLSVMGSAVRNSDGTMYSPGGNGDGASVPFIPSLVSISKRYSIVLFSRISAMTASWSALFDLPYSSGWSGSYASLSLQRNSSTAQLATNIGYNSTSRSMIAGTADLLSAPATTTSCFAVCKTSTGILFYKDGSYSTGYSLVEGSTLFDVAPDFSGRQPLTIANRSTTSVGEPTAGWFLPLIIYNRELSADELRQLNANPWRVFQPEEVFVRQSDYNGGDVTIGSLEVDGIGGALGGVDLPSLSASGLFTIKMSGSVYFRINNDGLGGIYVKGYGHNVASTEFPSLTASGVLSKASSGSLSIPLPLVTGLMAGSGSVSIEPFYAGGMFVRRGGGAISFPLLQSDGNLLVGSLLRATVRVPKLKTNGVLVCGTSMAGSVSLPLLILSGRMLLGVIGEADMVIRSMTVSGEMKVGTLGAGIMDIVPMSCLGILRANTAFDMVLSFDREALR